MLIKRICTAACTVAVFLTITANAGAAGVSYLPNVTKDMSEPSYWATDDKVLMTAAEIEERNALTIAQQGTNMYDLKNQAETVDGIALNEALLKSAKADVAYYLGWTYVDNDTVAAESEFEEFISNTQNPNAKREQQVLYGIAVKRTELMAFPTEKTIGDDPYDKDFDYRYLSSVRANEPLVITSVSADGKYYLAKNICCSGWVRAADVAICKDKSEWLAAWDISPEKALVVYGDKVYTECSNMAAETSELMLTMGTVLEQADIQNPNELIDNRAAYQNYVVWVPIRNNDGSYAKKITLISEHNAVSDGYLPLTNKNIAKVAFSALGNVYGWGGSLNSDDCSGYIRNIYKCFGLELARNTTWQSAMPMAKADMKNMCREERIRVIETLPLGSILYFDGHEMMYLGKRDNNYYVISSISSIMQPQNESKRQRIRSIVINTLDIKRANSNTWLDDLTLALIPYRTAENSQLPDDMWYHNGVAFCIKNKLMVGDENKNFNPDKNITYGEWVQVLKNCETVSGNKNDDLTAAEWAESIGLISECDLNAAITRENAAVLLYRYALYKGFDTVTDGGLWRYSDMADVSAYAVAAMEYATGKGLMNGKTQSTLNPKDNITRAEAAVITERFSGYFL